MDVSIIFVHFSKNFTVTLMLPIEYHANYIYVTFVLLAYSHIHVSTILT